MDCYFHKFLLILLPIHMRKDKEIHYIVTENWKSIYTKFLNVSTIPPPALTRIFLVPIVVITPSELN